MKTNKTIQSVAPHEKFDHEGNLIIEGDVGENACLNVREGSLTILGKIHKNAVIQQHVADELLNLVTGSISIVQTGNLKQMVIKGNVAKFKYRSANCSSSIGNLEILSGNVNIDNRIFTNDQVVILNDDEYKIIPVGDNAFSQFSGFRLFGLDQAQAGKKYATATIDGKEYSGKEILVKGKTVSINGEPQANENPAEEKHELQSPPKLIVHGDIDYSVTVTSDTDIEIKGNIDQFCRIHSNQGAITAQNIGAYTNIQARNQISVGTVEDSCTLISEYYGLEAERIKNGVTVDVRDTIRVSGDIGHECKIQSKYYGLKARHIGERSKIITRDAIKVSDVGSSASLTSQYYGVEANNLSDNVVLHARDGIQLNNVANECHIISDYSDIEISGATQQNVRMTARENIRANSIGNGNTLLSQYGKIIIQTSVAGHSTLQARESIRAKDVGEFVTLTSQYGDINVRNVAANASLNARNDIDVDGECAISARLNSSYGKVRNASVVEESHVGQRRFR
ncbi:MAG: hypothetical protein SFW66_07135 [Gammaproteobacteria bacterium]|nr:hypothetical protein [Gammaproteobacteria bacterium]